MEHILTSGSGTMRKKTSKTAAKKYRVTNWREYNKSLVNRGDITLWFDEKVLENWEHANDQTKVGRPFIFSDLAIETLLTLRELFRLPYRQTEGLGHALVKLMKVDIAIPHHTSLTKRAAKLNISTAFKTMVGPIDLVVDSTGLKVFGEGEWKVKKHGIGTRRTWRKLHLAVDPASQKIVGHTLTENNIHDGDQVKPLLDQIDLDINYFFGDGAYDQWKVHELLQEKEITAVIPPRKNAKIKQHKNSNKAPLVRDESLRQIRKIGSEAWKNTVEYHRRSLAETAMFRIKRCFGDKLKNRELSRQATEVAIRCKLLNLFVALGMPAFVWY
jgi:transposase